ncbi:MAG: HutD family protein, partial [Actinomycetes bacterium]
MEIIRFAGLKPQPWRNGGGVTRQVASHPAAG